MNTEAGVVWLTRELNENEIAEKSADAAVVKILHEKVAKHIASNKQ